MKVNWRVTAVLTLNLLTWGCEVFYGPVLKNAGSGPVEIRISYSNGTNSEVRLNPQNTFRHRRRDVAIEKLVVTRDGHATEYDSAAIRLLVGQVSSADAVFLIKDSGLDVVSVGEGGLRE